MSVVAILGILFSVVVHAALPMDRMPSAGVYLNSEGSPLLPLLKNAKKSIDIEIYTMSDPTVRALIRQALARRVKVRIIKDPKPLGEKCDLFDETKYFTEGKKEGDAGAPDASDVDCADQQKLVGDVRKAGGRFEPFERSALCPKGDNCFQHGKIALVDGAAMVSTGNFDTTNLCIAENKPARCNRDFSAVFTDSSIYSTLQRLFEADLKGVSYDVSDLIPPGMDGVLTVSPKSMNPILDFIDSARESIQLQAQYLKVPEMNAALIAAANRGVKVSLTVASVCAFGRPRDSEAKTISAIYSAFDKAKISTRMFNASNQINGKPGYMHAKVMVVDGERAWIGSENGSTQSLTKNREYGVIFDEADWVKSMEKVIAADHQSPDSETWRESLDCAKDF